MSIRLAISMGDFNGIGPEIILKSLPQIQSLEATPLLIGHEHIFKFYAEILSIKLPAYVTTNDPTEIQDGILNILELPHASDRSVEPGVFSVSAGDAAMQAVKAGINVCLNKLAHALVTAPISKEAVNKAGYHIPGHTEFLAEKTGTESYMMMLVHDQLRVGLVTIHIPVSQIKEHISTNTILKNMRIMDNVLRDDFNIAAPKIAVLGLNPHAGDGGIIGVEEIEDINPAITEAKSNGLSVNGPFPADGFFGNKHYENFDGVLAMYHDQGLVPFKTLSFGGGVNVTAGLPIVRTSPDHGTAFDIAGKNQADPSSFIEALKLAVELSNNRYPEAV